MRPLCIIDLTPLSIALVEEPFRLRHIECGSYCIQQFGTMALKNATMNILTSPLLYRNSFNLERNPSSHVAQRVS